MNGCGKGGERKQLQLGDHIYYVNWARAVAKGLHGVNPKLENEFENAAVAAERSFKPTL